MVTRTTLVVAIMAFLAGLYVDGTMPRLGAQEARDNPELARMYAEDQADRADADKIGWEKISARDATRLARARELYRADTLKTGPDYFHTALLLQHSHEASD